MIAKTYIVMFLRLHTNERPYPRSHAASPPALRAHDRPPCPHVPHNRRPPPKQSYSVFPVDSLETPHAVRQGWTSSVGRCALRTGAALCTEGALHGALSNCSSDSSWMQYGIAVVVTVSQDRGFSLGRCCISGLVLFFLFCDEVVRFGRNLCDIC